MKRLLIDVNPAVGYFLNGHVSGIGRTTLELVQALSKLEELPFEVTLFSHNFKGIGAKNLDVPFCKKHLYLRNNPTWNKIISKFPIREWFTGYDLQHITHNFEYVRHPEKCIVTLHDALFMKLQEQAFGHDKMKTIVPPFIRQCKHVVTCSESSKKDIVETMGVDSEKISVIYWGINHQRFRVFGDKADVARKLQEKFQLLSPYILSVSCNAERKRTDRLVRAYIEYGKTNVPQNDLVLVWGNPPQDLLNDIAKSRCRDKIHILKNVSDDDLALLYNGAKVFVFPSVYEGFGLPIIEAMACGTPVVTCKNSSLSEIAQDAAIYLEEPVEQSLVATLVKIEADQFPWDELVAKGLQRAKQFNWQNTARETASVYARCLGISV